MFPSQAALATLLSGGIQPGGRSAR